MVIFFGLFLFISSSGLGYIVGTGVAKLLDGWQWGLRVSVFMLLNKISGTEALDPTGSISTPPGRDASPSQVIPPQFVRFPNNLPVLIYTPGWREAL